MKQKIITILLVGALSFSASPAYARHFNDTIGKWYQGSVDFVSEKGFMNGVSNNIFNAEATMKRGDFAMVLYNMAQKDGYAGKEFQEGTAHPFYDVADHAYYKKAIDWVVSNGIAHGVGENYFAPEQPIKRQEAAVMILNFTQGYQVKPERVNTPVYKDADKISGYAVYYVNRISELGLMNGDNQNNFNPLANIKRGEIASIIERLEKKHIPLNKGIKTGKDEDPAPNVRGEVPEAEGRLLAVPYDTAVIGQVAFHPVLKKYVKMDMAYIQERDKNKPVVPEKPAPKPDVPPVQPSDPKEDTKTYTKGQKFTRIEFLDLTEEQKKQVAVDYKDAEVGQVYLDTDFNMYLFMDQSGYDNKIRKLNEEKEQEQINNWYKEQEALAKTHSFTDYQLYMLSEINKEREKVGVAPLKLLPALCDLAEIRADEGLQRNIIWRERYGDKIEGASKFAHSRLDGRDCETIISDNYPIFKSIICRENLTTMFSPLNRNKFEVSTAQNNFVNSPGHYRNMIAADVKYVGIGYHDNSQGQTYSQLFLG